jgi:hypothetical protein
MTTRFKVNLVVSAALLATAAIFLSVTTLATAAPDQAQLALAADVLKKAAILVKQAGPDRAGHTFKAMADIEAAINEVKAAAAGTP